MVRPVHKISAICRQAEMVQKADSMIADQDKTTPSILCGHVL